MRPITYFMLCCIIVISGNFVTAQQQNKDLLKEWTQKENRPAQLKELFKNYFNYSYKITNKMGRQYGSGVYLETIFACVPKKDILFITIDSKIDDHDLLRAYIRVYFSEGSVGIYNFPMVAQDDKRFGEQLIRSFSKVSRKKLMKDFPKVAQIIDYEEQEQTYFIKDSDKFLKLIKGKFGAIWPLMHGGNYQAVNGKLKAMYDISHGGMTVNN